MNLETATTSIEASEEISALIETLFATEQRLEELTGGEVDTVASRDGRTFMLRRAQEQLRYRDAAKQAATLNELRVLFNLMPAMVWFKDTNDHILRVNQRVADTAGKSIEEIEGKLSSENYPQEAARHYVDDLEVIRSGKPKMGIVETIRNRHGEPIWIETDKVPYCDQDGKVIGIVVMAQDITERKRTEESLRASEENMAAAQRIAHFGSWELDLTKDKVTDLHALRWSDEMFRIAGYEPGEVEASNELFFRLVHPQDRESVRQAVATAISERHEYSIVHRLIRPNGQTRSVQEMGQVFFDKVSGLPLKIVGTAHDITDRKRSEAALRESQQRFAGAFEHAPIGVALVSPEGRWLKVNQALCNVVGYSEAELLSRSFQDMTHPEDLESDLERVRQLLTGEIRTYQVEKRYIHSRGHPVTVLVNASLVRDGDGEPCYLITQIQDITERKQAAQALQRSRKRLRDIIDGMGPSMFVALLTPEGILIEINQPPLTAGGLKAEEVLGKPFDETPWWSHSLEIQRQLREAITRGAQGEPSRYDVRTRGLGGRVIDIDFSLQPLRDETGVVVFLIPSACDITDRKRAEAELEKTHKEFVEASRKSGMAEMATGVLHNVGNVLNSVNVASSSMAESLKKSKAGNLAKVVTMLRNHEGNLGIFLTSDPKGKRLPAYLAELADHLAGEQAVALKELAQLQRNIEHIKEVVTVQQSSAKDPCKLETLQLMDLVEDTLRMDAGETADRGIQIIKEFGHAPSIRVEKHKVLQILMNLVRNAKQSCQESDRADKRLTLRITDGDDRVGIAVSDNGMGISPENLARIFAHGFTTKNNGHGFGLHSAIAAAKEMGGELCVHSDGVGRGATFTLQLPLGNPFSPG